MSKKFKVVGLTKGIVAGTSIPMKQKDGNIGRWGDDTMKNNGYETDKSGLIDCPKLEVEFKTRKDGSTAPHTIASATIGKICSFPSWEESDFYIKLSAHQYRIHYDDETSIVRKSKIYDFTDSLDDLGKEFYILQAKTIKFYQNYLADVLAGNYAARMENYFPKQINAAGRAIFDGYGDPNSYRFRVTDKMMKIMENRSENAKAFNANFTVS